MAVVLSYTQAAVDSASAVAARPSFDEYLKQFGKSYSAAEYADRKASYEKRLTEIVKHNSQLGVLWSQGVNKFTDGGLRKPASWSRQKPTAPLSNDTQSQSHGVPVPWMVDWRTHQPPVLTPPLDQGDCGICWAISATKALESHLAITTAELLTLSTQAVADCAADGNTEHNCSYGGAVGDAFHLASREGVPLAKHYPRLNTGAPCKLGTKGAKPAIGVKGFGKIHNDAHAMMHVLATRGPVSIGVDSSRWDPYQGGIFDGCSKSSVSVDHEVLLVGYGEEHGIKFWIAQNSWGTDWGEEGFIRLRRYDNEPCTNDAADQNFTDCGECGLLAEGTYPIGAFRHSGRRLSADDADSLWV